MTDETPKCGYCQKRPNQVGVLVACWTPECPQFALDMPWVNWCLTQTRILAARRKDFEAGQSSMCDSQERVNTKVAMSFDDYLARGGE